MDQQMLAAAVSMNLRSSALFRSFDLAETASVIAHLMKKLQSHPAPAAVGGLQPPRSKRQRCSDNVFLLQLMCVPTISERIAGKLVERFGDLESTQDALRANTFPRIQIGEKTFVGKARIATLKRHLLRTAESA